MAIRRCPYCKAIIDEADKYCNNCGTQLLFPEDEYVEEEIPGDKITEEEDEDEEGENDEGEEEEVEEIEEVEGWDGEEKGKEREEEEEREETGGVEKEEEIEETEIEEEEEEEFFEEAGSEEVRLKEEELREKYEVALEDDELIFKTKDLEKLTRTVDEGEKGVEAFIEAHRGEDAGEEKEEDEDEKKLEAGEEERPPDTSEDLPPWVSGLKEARPPVMDSAEIEETEEEDEMEEIEEMAEEKGKTAGEEAPATPATGQEWTQDSGIGVPESVTQAGLAFTDTTAVEAEAASEDGYGREGEKVRKERTLSFSMKMKSKFVDFVFITAIWLISLWFTAQVIDVSFFRLFSRSPLHVLGFYFILLFLYFFLFLYFLGETLGDHYFSAED